jgi:alpha-tubulin suppressor-like RCC1 family protein/protocatechuate 3,4-dioxygenase beta subunit
MHGRKLVTTGTVTTLAILALLGACGEATTGPTSVKPQDFAAALRLLSGNQQSGAVGAALSEVLTVKVVDAGGQPVAGATVLWQVRDGGGTINPAASTSSVSGLASVTWTMGSALGANKAVAILQGAYVKDSVVFTATAGVGAASQLTLVAGNAQTGRVAAALAQQLTVNVKDQFGHPVPGKRVTWAAGLFSGTVTGLADSTDSSGNASANWVLGTSVTAMTATASVAGIASPVAFTATGTPDTSRVMTVTASPAVSAAAGASVGTMTVKVTDRFGNVIVGDSVNFADSTSGGSSVTARMVATNASGLASSTWTLGPNPGPQVARARLMPRQDRVTFSSTAWIEFTQVVAGNYQACAIGTNDRAYCWGFGEDGQLGKGNQKTTFAPTSAVSLTADSILGPFPTFRTIQQGRTHACGITVAKQMICWGRINGNTLQMTPTAVTFTPPTTVSTIALGERHTCMTTPSGLAYCTGTNDEGELGNGSTTSAANYVAVLPALSTWSNIAAGSLHTCGVPRYAGAGTVRPWCWGFNSAGQLGDGTQTTSLTAVAVTLPALVTEIDSTSLVVGAAHSCAIVSVSTSLTSPAGSVICWGSNGYGQLGTAAAYTSTSFSNIAVAAAPGLTFTSLTAGEYHTCGISAAGVAYCWGRNNAGQLGDGSTVASTSTPVQVAGAVSWRSITAGELFTCGVSGSTGVSGTTADAGTVYCWGDNEYGQIGQRSAGTNGQPVRSPIAVKGQRANP